MNILNKKFAEYGYGHVRRNRDIREENRNRRYRDRLNADSDSDSDDEIDRTPIIIEDPKVVEMRRKYKNMLDRYIEKNSKQVFCNFIYYLNTEEIDILINIMKNRMYSNMVVFKSIKCMICNKEKFSNIPIVEICREHKDFGIRDLRKRLYAIGLIISLVQTNITEGYLFDRRIIYQIEQFI